MFGMMFSPKNKFENASTISWQIRLVKYLQELINLTSIDNVDRLGFLRPGLDFGLGLHLGLHIDLDFVTSGTQDAIHWLPSALGC